MRSLRGSLHKYKNNGKQNYDDFYFTELLRALYKLKYELFIDPDYTPLNKLEIGLNINLDYNPEIFLDSIASFKNDYRPSRLRDSNMNLIEFKTTKYIFKIYDKGLRHNLSENLLRVEVAIVTSYLLHKLGVKVLSDIMNPTVISNLIQFLFETYDKLLITDDFKESPDINKRHKDLLEKGSDPKYWYKFFKENNSRKYQRYRKFYKELISKYGTNNFCEIPGLMKKKIYELNDLNNIIDKDNYQLDLSQLSYLDNGELCDNTNSNNGECVNCGKNISEKKNSARFCSDRCRKSFYWKKKSFIQELCFIFNNEKTLWDKKSQLRLSWEHLYLLHFGGFTTGSRMKNATLQTNVNGK